MDGVVIAAFVMILTVGVVLALYALPVALILWVISRLLGRRAGLLLGIGIAGYLGYYALTAHLGCSTTPQSCDSPGMMLFGPITYVVIPLMMAVTALLLRRIWVDLEPGHSGNHHKNQAPQ